MINWGQEGETVKYYEYKKYYFKPELSADWDQDIVTVNPIVAVSIRWIQLFLYFFLVLTVTRSSEVTHLNLFILIRKLIT